MPRRVHISTKSEIRREVRAERKTHVAALDPSIQALIFRIPPRPILELIDAAMTIGLYAAAGDEAPANAYARHFYDAGHHIALPYFSDRDSDMAFRQWQNPYDENTLAAGPYGMAQPRADDAIMTPDVLIMPLIAFTSKCERLGQGGGHYDRYLAIHNPQYKIGLAYDIQERPFIPTEPHDVPLDYIVTPTRLIQR